MKIEYVLQCHGLGVTSSQRIYEGVTNLTSVSQNDGKAVILNWTNPVVEEYVRTEVYWSTNDLSNMTYSQCVTNGTLIGTTEETVTVSNTTIGTTYYFKVFVAYNTFGENVVSDGSSTFVIAQDIIPPNPVLNFTVLAGDGLVTLSWVNPTQEDFAGVKILRKLESYPTSVTDGEVVYTGANVAYIDNTVENDMTYYYRIFTYDLNGNYNTDEIGQTGIATPMGHVIYGVRIDTTNSNPETALTYTDDAVGFTPANGNNGNFQYGSWRNRFPFNQIKPCVYKDGAVNYYLNPNNFAIKDDGTPSDITSGVDGDVMIEFPKFYWKFQKAGTDLYVRISDIQQDSGYKCLAHILSSREEDVCYLSAYLGTVIDGKLRSLSGKEPTRNNIENFRMYAQANGIKYNQMIYTQMIMLQILFLLMFKNRDSQTALGKGLCYIRTGFKLTGGTDSKGMYYGSTDNELQNKFCGIEDIWGNFYYFADGMRGRFPDYKLTIATNNFADLGTYTDTGFVCTENSGFVKEVFGTTEVGFFPSVVDGSTTTYYCDQCYPWNAYSNSGFYYFGGCHYHSPIGDHGMFLIRAGSTDDGYKSARLSAM